MRTLSSKITKTTKEPWFCGCFLEKAVTHLYQKHPFTTPKKGYIGNKWVNSWCSRLSPWNKSFTCVPNVSNQCNALSVFKYKCEYSTVLLIYGTKWNYEHFFWNISKIFRAENWELFSKICYHKFFKTDVVVLVSMWWEYLLLLMHHYWAVSYKYEQNLI